MITKLVFMAGIYCIWESKNEMTINDVITSKIQILKNVEQIVKLNLMDRKFKENDTVRNRKIVGMWDCRASWEI